MSTAPADKPQGIRTILWLEKYMSIIFLVLFIALACLSGAYHHRVYSHAELFEPPYSPYIKPGTDGPLITACLLTCIGVAVFLLSIFIPHSGLWWLACVVTRFSLATGLIASAVLQSQYMPLPLGSCENDNMWRDPTDITEGTPTMFEVLPIYSGKNKFGRRYKNRPCEALITIWRFEIALAVLTVLWGLCACFLVAYAMIADSPATSAPLGAALQWLGKPFKSAAGWGKGRRSKERKEAEAKLLATDPEGMEYVDHEMGIRVRPI
ncbi:hypothetical protein BDV27DRAFT_153575 [Aspergillus caelatus]|uniref:Uncharacterized protein n=2 Tax=Aspergillus subgen. Circumdati TaxID=2720871 RepID=A0A5N7AGD2_9EURO|nr:uncharacterized protein BDV27DRAFT_153575 [Aspergillus caelatus]KAE8368941.1 hypothetical protein BDV27DRAFT_153575 [Aspergillus caelatus]KAE8420367.1 hypothetical protein BDV36DRAFT_293256 [Aspergillus pseudocaelatus]